MVLALLMTIQSVLKLAPTEARIESSSMVLALLMTIQSVLQLVPAYCGILQWALSALTFLTSLNKWKQLMTKKSSASEHRQNFKNNGHLIALKCNQMATSIANQKDSQKNRHIQALALLKAQPTIKL